MDEQFANVAKKTRYMVRKAGREGVDVRRSNSAADVLEVFYRQHVTTRRRLGVPVQPRRFFEVLARDYIEPGLGFVVIASLGDTPVASAVFLAWNRRIEYKYSASDRSHGDVGAGQAVVWDAIRWDVRTDISSSTSVAPSVDMKACAASNAPGAGLNET